MKFVQYGAGNIGRGFIGQLFSQAGYEVVYIDVNKELIGKMNEDRRYPVRIVSREGARDVWVSNVRGVDGMDREAVSREIATADIMATAVGVNILPRIAANIAAGLTKRWLDGKARPLDAIICENMLHADSYIRELVRAELKPELHALLDSKAGFVEASIGRMVPVMTPEMQDGNILRVCVEEYGELPVDKAAFKGQIPAVPSLKPFSPFEFFIERKLFIHNMGHATTAYLGRLAGAEYIWQAVGDPAAALIAQRAMTESAQALSKLHGVPLTDIIDHVEDLLYRFGNPALGDTVDRVGRDLTRKMGADDRLAGAIKACRKAGVVPAHICVGLAAALYFSGNGDGPDIKDGDIAPVLTGLCKIDPASPEGRFVKQLHTMLGQGASFGDLLAVAAEAKHSGM